MRGLPDPSQRAWRHPSEMSGSLPLMPGEGPGYDAAGASSFTASLFSKGLFGVVALLVATATVYQLAVASRTTSSDTFSAQNDTAADGDTTSTDALSGTQADAPLSGAQSSATLPDLTPEQPDSFAQKTVAQGTLFASNNADSPVATVMIMGDVMVTSASAVDNYQVLWLEGDDRRTRFNIDILGFDQFADIAVLAAPVRAGTIEGEPGLLLEELIALPQFEAEQVQDVVVGDAAVSTAKNGAVIGVDEAILHNSGHTIYSAIITSIPFEDHLAGAPLTTPAGDLVGFVVNAAGAVVAALPVDDFIRLAQSLLTLDENQDFALELSPDDSGRPVVADVDPAGPFATDLAGGDVVVAVDGTKLLDTDHLTHLMRRLEPGQSVVLTVERSNRRFETSELRVDDPHLAVNPISEP